MKALILVSAFLATVYAGPIFADWTEARCDIHKKGSDHIGKRIHCTFGQRQGSIAITREDRVTHDIFAADDTPGNFRDQLGRTVYRQSGLGDQGLIFRFPDESVYVYWSTADLEPASADNPSMPFATKDYDAATLLRCRAVGDAKFGKCPAGILRMEDKQASIVVQDQAGEQFTINSMTGYVNATNREAKARLEDDTWTVIINGEEEYQIPLAAIEGG